MDNFSGPDICSLLRSSFNEIHAQSHVLADRSKIFGYHHYLLNQKLDLITALATDYLLGFIQVLFPASNSDLEISFLDLLRATQNAVLFFNKIWTNLTRMLRGSHTKGLRSLG